MLSLASSDASAFAADSDSDAFTLKESDTLADADTLSESSALSLSDTDALKETAVLSLSDIDALKEAAVLSLSDTDALKEAAVLSDMDALKEILSDTDVSVSAGSFSASAEYSIALFDTPLDN